MRSVFVRLHRYLGLATALFIVSAGLTGSLIAWNDSLERFFAPRLFVLPPRDAGAATLDPFVLRERAAQAYPDAELNDMPLRLRANEPAIFDLQYATGGADRDDQAFLDPVDGRILGSRRQGDLRQGLQNIMPFVYSIHESLALGDAGTVVLGITAFVWLVQCFLGGYLTLPYARVSLPRRAPAVAPRSWLQRWAVSWKMRVRSDLARSSLNIHRAGGLWLWGLLSIFAASAMSFNLPTVYKPIVSHLLGSESRFDALPEVQLARPAAVSWRHAYAAAVSAMEDASKAGGFSVLSERLMMLHKDKHVYEYRIQTSRDVEARGNTQVWIDADSGHVLGIDYPTGTASGNTFTTWIEALHEATIGGLFYKLVVTAVGFFAATLSVTGFIIWTKKRKSAAIVFRARATSRH